MTLGSNFADSNESDIAEKSTVWPSSHHEEKGYLFSLQRGVGLDDEAQMMRHDTTYKNMLSGIRTPGDSHAQLRNEEKQNGFRTPFFEQTLGDANPLKSHFEDQEGQLHLLSGPWPLMPAQASELYYQKIGNARYGMLGGYPPLQGLGVDQHPAKGLTNLWPTSQMENPSQTRVMKPQPSVGANQNEVVKPRGSGNHKIIGIHLSSNPTITELAMSPMKATYVLESYETYLLSEPSKGTKSSDSAPIVGPNLHHLLIHLILLLYCFLLFLLFYFSLHDIKAWLVADL